MMHLLVTGLVLALTACAAIPGGEATVKPEDRTPKDGDTVAVLDTTQGRIVVMFFDDIAPNHAKKFREACEKGIYSGTRFHRVIPGFMIQGGDPSSKEKDRSVHGTGGYGDPVKAEFSKVPHVRGILSAARTADPNSFRSQFFIMHARSPHLDGQYSVFGKVVEGLDVVDKIVSLDKDMRDNPKDDEASRIKSATLQKWPLKKPE